MWQDGIYIPSGKDKENGIYNYKPPGKDNNISKHHSVMIVGFGTLKEKNYWLIKNSWGREWGSEGYGKILRLSSVEKIYPKDYMIIGVVYPIIRHSTA
jgi:hypothetical protein